MHRTSPFLVLSLALLVASCASGPQVVSAGPQTYSVSAEDELKWNATTVPARELVFGAANQYCAKRKLVMVPVSLDVRPGEIGVRTATADLVFRAMRPGDPEIGRAQAVFRHYDPMVVRESVVRFAPDGSERPATAKP